MTEGVQRRAPYLADSADILHWSDRVDARTEFPRLIRRLIQENNDQVARIEMRAAEGAGVPGFDGVVEASRGTPFVPDGTSCWELGVGLDPQDKANSDYRKRTDELGAGKDSDATFVFVTSRRWAGKRAWEAEKRAEGRWRDVRAFDVDDIELALEAAPAVHVWFSEIVGKPARGAQSVEDWWDQFAGRTNPPLTPALVLSGREDSAAELIRLLTQDRSFTTIGAASVDDDLAFIAATILSADEDLQSRVLGQTLVVRDPEFLRRLAGASHLLLLVPTDGQLRREAESVRGHHIVFLSDEDSPADVVAPAIDQREFAQQLTDLGVGEERAERLAQAAHRSFHRFQRLASTTGSVQVPEWPEQLRSRIVRRAWLAGGWNTDRSGDTDVLTTLFGIGYSEAADELWQAGRGTDPLFSHVGDAWSVATPEDSWAYGCRQVTSSDLQAIETAIQSVLGAIDPALDLPVEDRWMAAIYGKAPLHSSSLRKGMATTLALFGAQGEVVELGSGSTGQSWAKYVAFSLLDRANKDSNGQLWASLSDVLPLLAEAAPDVFLSAVQTGLEGADPLLRKLFLDQNDGFSVDSPHTGLLWALETVAWSTSHFGLATELLACLAEIDPGGRLSNRPAQSLVDIFRPWMPQTSAGATSRFTALKALVRRHPAVGWNLLLALLPESYATGLSTHAPRFRRWKPAAQGVTYHEFWEFSSTVAELILEATKREPLRWAESASRLADFPPPQRTQAYTQLQELSEQALPDEVRIAIWEKLDEELRKHRTFPDTWWVLPTAELDRLEQVLEALKPGNSLARNRWLFDGHFLDVGRNRRDDHDAYEAEVARLRATAIAEILNQGGLADLSRLASQLSQSWLVGVTLADAMVEVEPEDVIGLLDSEDPKEVEFAYAYVARASEGRLEWILPFAEELTGRPLGQARLLAASEDLEETWEVANNLGSEVDTAYWKGFRTTGRGGDFGLVNRTARQLLEHGRPAAALDLLALYRAQNNDPAEPSLVIDAFEAFLKTEDEEIRLLSNWDIEQLLEFLRCSRVDETVLASLEWRLLPALRFDASSPILERRLAHDPEFFVEVLSLCFKPRSGEMEREVLPEVSKNAYCLLHDWKLVPGSDEPGGEITEDRLRAWVAETRQLLIEADREIIGEQYIGKVLAHSPNDEDGTWPALAVRNLIEESSSQHLEKGFHMGTNNKRGVTSRGIAEGGEQEYKLAQNYDGWANSVSDEWPRTAALLRALADGFRAEGRTHDDDARRFKEGLER